MRRFNTAARRLANGEARVALRMAQNYSSLMLAVYWGERREPRRQIQRRRERARVPGDQKKGHRGFIAVLVRRVSGSSPYGTWARVRR
jgi:hypothetical protein